MARLVGIDGFLPSLAKIDLCNRHLEDFRYAATSIIRLNVVQSRESAPSPGMDYSPAPRRLGGARGVYERRKVDGEGRPLPTSSEPVIGLNGWLTIE